MTKTLTIVLASMLVLAFAACGDDSSAGNNNPPNCTDNDGDGYGVGSDCTGPDCNDDDAQCYNTGDACCTATDCTDADGDGYGTGTDCLGDDCDDANNQCWAGACCPNYDCADLDGDGYGNGADCTGPDCNDSDPACYQSGDPCCGGAGCTDLDGDGYGVGSTCAGPDCNDSDPACNSGTCCPAGNGNVGEACGDPSQCNLVTNGTPECVTDLGGYMQMPGGYCTGTGCNVGQPCDSSTGICVDLFIAQACLKACSASTECRESEGYTCSQLPMAQPTDPTYCLPPMGTGP